MTLLPTISDRQIFSVAKCTAVCGTTIAVIGIAIAFFTNQIFFLFCFTFLGMSCFGLWRWGSIQVSQLVQLENNMKTNLSTWEINKDKLSKDIGHIHKVNTSLQQINHNLEESSTKLQIEIKELQEQLVQIKQFNTSLQKELQQISIDGETHNRQFQINITKQEEINNCISNSLSDEIEQQKSLESQLGILQDTLEDAEIILEKEHHLLKRGKTLEKDKRDFLQKVKDLESLLQNSAATSTRSNQAATRLPSQRL